jgi:CRP-like cAMP-binding protein
MSIPIERQFRPGQSLFREGEPSHCMYLIKKGTVAIRKMKGTAYVELGRIYANEVLGELSFFDRHPRSASAVALTEVEALEISFESLDAIYVKVPDYLKTIMASVADRLRKANEQIRKLQKNVITEEGREEQLNPLQMSAAEALETTREIEAPKVEYTKKDED